MAEQLTTADLELILTSLEYSKKHFSEYRDYPSEDFRKARIASVESVIKKVRALRANAAHPA